MVKLNVHFCVAACSSTADGCAAAVQVMVKLIETNAQVLGVNDAILTPFLVPNPLPSLLTH